MFQLVVFLVVLSLLYWLLLQLPLPPPFPLVVKVVFVLIAVYWLLGFAGFAPHSRVYWWR